MSKTYRSMEEIEEAFFPNAVRERILNSDDYEAIGKMFAEETVDSIRGEMEKCAENTTQEK